MNKQSKELEDGLEKKMLMKVLKETKEGKIQWKQGKLESSSEFGFTAEWEGKRLELSKGTEGLLVTLSYYILEIFSDETSVVIYGGAVLVSFIPVRLSWRTIRPLQKLYSFARRQEELNCRKNEKIERLKNRGILKKSL